MKSLKRYGFRQRKEYKYFDKIGSGDTEDSIGKWEKQQN